MRLHFHHSPTGLCWGVGGGTPPNNAKQAKQPPVSVFLSRHFRKKTLGTTGASGPQQTTCQTTSDRSSRSTQLLLFGGLWVGDLYGEADWSRTHE